MHSVAFLLLGVSPSKQKASFGDVVKQLGIMGVAVFVVKQSPLLMEIYDVTQAQMFTDDMMYPSSLSSKLNF